MLVSILQEKRNNCLVVIEDKTAVKGDDLFTALTRECSRSDEEVKIDLFCFENPPEFYSKRYDSSKIVNHNCFSDPCGWFNESPPVNVLNILHNSDVKPNGTVFIDSLSNLIINEGFPAVYKCLHELKNKTKKIVCLFHGDVISSSDNKQKLKFLSTTYIRLVECSSVPDVLGKLTLSKIYEFLHKKPGGKVNSQMREFSVDSDYKIFDYTLTKKSKEKTVTQEETKLKMESLTTFKLGLEISSNEQAAKKKLILPYLRTSTENEGRVNQQMSIGEDSEEDPDEDLDI